MFHEEIHRKYFNIIELDRNVHAIDSFITFHKVTPYDVIILMTSDINKKFCYINHKFLFSIHINNFQGVYKNFRESKFS